MNQIILKCQRKFHISWLASKIIVVKKGESMHYGFSFPERRANANVMKDGLAVITQG